MLILLPLRFVRKQDHGKKVHACYRPWFVCTVLTSESVFAGPRLDEAAAGEGKLSVEAEDIEDIEEKAGTFEEKKDVTMVQGATATLT